MRHILVLPPVLLLAIAAAMAGLHRAMPLASWLNPPWSYLGWLLLAGGLLLAQWHARLFRRVGANIQTFGTPAGFTRQGLFARTRNPMYLGMLLALAGWAGVLGTVSPLLGPVVFFALAQYWYIPFEERAMARSFGADYERYCQEVRRWG